MDKDHEISHRVDPHFFGSWAGRKYRHIDLALNWIGPALDHIVSLQQDRANAATNTSEILEFRRNIEARYMSLPQSAAGLDQSVMNAIEVIRADALALTTRLERAVSNQPSFKTVLQEIEKRVSANMEDVLIPMTKNPETSPDTVETVLWLIENSKPVQAEAMQLLQSMERYLCSSEKMHPKVVRLQQFVADHAIPELEG